MISVVVPVRGEASPEAALLAPLVAPGVELVVAAEESATSAATLAGWREAGARLLSSTGARGARLRQAARETRGDVLLFLHADTLLPEGWREAVLGAVAAGLPSGAFRLAFAEPSRPLALVAATANLRTALTRVPYGDQAPFATRAAYEAVGGHPPWPLLDDLELSRRLARAGKVALLPLAVATSGRRYLARGVARTVLGNWLTLARFRLGASPETLAEAYRRR